MKFASRFFASLKKNTSDTAETDTQTPANSADARPDDTDRPVGRVPMSIAGLKKIIKSFSPVERVVFSAMALVFVFGTLGVIQTINSMYEIEVPASGSSLTEGVVGVPQFINPVLASSDADRDL